MASNSKYAKLPKGVAGYVHVKRPSRKYKKFEVTVSWKDPALVQEHIDAVNEMIQEEFGPKKAAKAHTPFKIDGETGEVTLKTTSQFAPSVFNAKGEKITRKRVPNVWSGSVVKVGVKFDPYDNDGKFGITARFQSIQIIKLVEGEGMGFEADDSEEDAYTDQGVEPEDDDEDDRKKDEDDEDEDDEKTDADDEEEDEAPKKASGKGKKKATDF